MRLSGSLEYPGRRWGDPPPAQASARSLDLQPRLVEVALCGLLCAIVSWPVSAWQLYRLHQWLPGLVGQVSLAAALCGMVLAGLLVIWKVQPRNLLDVVGGVAFFLLMYHFFGLPWLIAGLLDPTNWFIPAEPKES